MSIGAAFFDRHAPRRTFRPPLTRIAMFSKIDTFTPWLHLCRFTSQSWTPYLVPVATTTRGPYRTFTAKSAPCQCGLCLVSPDSWLQSGSGSGSAMRITAILSCWCSRGCSGMTWRGHGRCGLSSSRRQLNCLPTRKNDSITTQQSSNNFSFRRNHLAHRECKDGRGDGTYFSRVTVSVRTTSSRVSFSSVSTAAMRMMPSSWNR